MKRDKRIEKAIRFTWASLESHLVYATGERKSVEPGESIAFHKQAIREYAFTLKVLAELL